MHLVSLPLKLSLSGFNSEQKIVLCKFSQKISEKMTAVCEVLWQNYVYYIPAIAMLILMGKDKSKLI